jgi:hypothetical protein
MAEYGTSTNAGQHTVVGLFKDKTSAEQAYDFIMDLGYGRDETSVVMSDETRNKHFTNIASADSELGNKAAEGAGVGGAIGSVVGGLVGALAAIGTSVVLPGVGLVVAGPLAAALVGAGTGGVTGGLIGALIGSGIPDESARSYEESIRKGGILISVLPRTEEDAERINREWKQIGGDILAR